MRLKRLEMVGFKSFADRTRVEFEAGITAIVGPNGCGKSNISDSIRWALGEMSAKSLRSHQMLDVIFNGTANRSPQGMSEVALTFDNASHQLPIDYSEVTVSRRLFRSGESEYFINKTQCRLKDVRDLFLDTGVGNDGYYVMAQGKIEFILSAKPEERRELFEEAAGVSKYKARRDEAVRRLSKVDQDMLRLNDSLAIYKQQMDSLDAAVRKAKQHQKLQEELRSLEIASLVQNYVKAQTDWDTLHSEHLALEERLSGLREQVHQGEADLSVARETAEREETELLDLQKQAAQTESEWAKTEAERQAAIERHKEVVDDQARLGEEVARLQAERAQWTEAHARIAAELEEFRVQFHARNERFKEEDLKGRDDQEKATAQQKELEQARARLLELVRLISHHRNETVRLTSLSIRYEESSKGKEREREKVALRRGAMDEQVKLQEGQAAETAERLQTIQNALRDIDQLQSADQQRVKELEADIHQARERLARLDAEKIALERWLGQDPMAKATHALRDAKLAGIYGPISDLFKTTEPYQRLLDRALGDRREFFIADTLNDAQEAVRFLSEGRRGWASFLVLDHLTQDAGLIPFAGEAAGTRSLAVQVSCEDRFRNVLQFLLSKTFFVGATVFEEGLIRGGADPEGESFQATPSDLQRLVQDISNLNTVLSQNTIECDRLQLALVERSALREPIQQDESQAKVLAQVQQETLARLREERDMSHTEEQILVRELEEASQGIAQTQQNLEKEEVLLTTLEAEEQALQGTVQTQEAVLQELRQTLQVHQTLVSQLRVEAETMRERVIGTEKEENNARGRLAAISERATQVEQEQSQNAERLEQLNVLQAEKADRLEGLRVTREAQQATLEQLLAHRQILQEQLRKQDENLSALREALSSAQTKAQEADFKSKALAQERDRFEQSLLDGYQLAVQDARLTHGEISVNHEELARIRRRLDVLGAVNLAAPEEHAQLEERYQFLLTQQQDLMKAKEDLHQAIAKINATTREHFRATFDLVRANFKMLYQTLFQGGEADVILTDEHNLMETGVDILAQPPGKKLQSIALLSGGEKALTAIALLFAFFMVKPSPFCLLDEVDAPLDEANVQRFLRLVKSFSEKTQFIMITHNKRSMEMADVLYGVTMAELGISSLISVKLEEAKSPDVVAA